MKALRLNKICFFVLLPLTLVFSACSSKSYPADQIKQSLAEICRTEYGIEKIDVKINGNTIGVYLPLNKLFSTDFKGSVIAGKVRNLETLFEPSPEALDKVEDVLFSISRVLLSTDKNFQFYILQATDVENTGLQLILKGFVDDVKRVRVWDISRNEYRKRVIHEMRQNRAVLWHRPVRQFFDDLAHKDLQIIMDEYFGSTITKDSVKELFFNLIRDSYGEEDVIDWEILEMRSARVQRGEVLVYTKTYPMLNGEAFVQADKAVEFLFLVSYKGAQPKILRIIPFQYLDETGGLQKIPFPEDLQMEESLEAWEEEFPVENILLGDFLAEQLTRRVAELLATDERILNTFSDVKIKIEFDKAEEQPSFNFVFDSVILRNPDINSFGSLILNEDVIYLLDLISRDFVNTLRSYQFGNYDHLSVKFMQESDSREHVFARSDMELFREKKTDFGGLVSSLGI